MACSFAHRLPACVPKSYFLTAVAGRIASPLSQAFVFSLSGGALGAEGAEPGFD